MKKDQDYSISLAIIAIWIVIGSLTQCENVRQLNGIRQELRGIKNELNTMRYK